MTTGPTQYAERSVATRTGRPGAAARPPARARGNGHKLGFTFLSLLGIAVAAAAVGTGYSWQGGSGNGGGGSGGNADRGNLSAPAAIEIPTDPKALKQLESRLEARRRKLEASLDRLAPRGYYIVIDQTQNQLFLRKDDDLLLDAECSAGSGMVLKNPKGGEWVFDTPRGMFKVLSKIENPVWKKPDWAFVEEGKPIPVDPGERIEPGSLGEYALYFGNGYMIHGTLYERFLRRSVSHGCIRVGRDNLRELYRATNIGTPIYIY